MDIYLPIAEMAVNVFVILAIGSSVGFLSGLFGVGGGFLMTPLLIFIGIPPAVAVASGANQIVAPSVSGVLAHWKRGNVDVRMGLVLLIGGFVGSSVGVWIFALLRGIGQIDLVIKLSFVVMLSVVGLLMLKESIQSSLHRGAPPRRNTNRRNWLLSLPLKMRFRRSRLYISVLLPVAVGFVVGVLAAILGVAGGFIMIPAMIYLLGMPTSVVVGTSLFQIIFVAANVTILQAATNRSVDILLAILLMIGAVIGAEFGVRANALIRADHLRILLAVLVLAVAGNLAYDLVAKPADLYSLSREP